MPVFSLNRHYQRECLCHQEGSYNISSFVLTTWDHSCFFSSETLKQVLNQVFKSKTIDPRFAKLVEHLCDEDRLYIRVKARVSSRSCYIQTLSNFIQEIGC